jgi:hypothetical protein
MMMCAMEHILQALLLGGSRFHMKGIAMDQVFYKGEREEPCNKEQNARTGTQDAIVYGISKQDCPKTIENGQRPGNVYMGYFFEDRVLKNPVLDSGVIICHILSDL